MRRAAWLLIVPFYTLMLAVSVVEAQLTIHINPPEPLLGPSSLVYQGAFKLPIPAAGHTGPSGSGFDYAIDGLAFNAANHSLFVNGHIWYSWTAEVSIPTPSLDRAHLPTATFLQDFADTREGHLTNVKEGGGANPGMVNGTGAFVYHGRYIGTQLIYYDADNNTRLGFYAHSLMLAKPSFQGMYSVGPDTMQGFIAGYMASIPASWQARLGGPVFAGQTGLPIVSRQSFGPTAWAFNPDDIGTVIPAPATPLVYYDINHPTLGRWAYDEPPGNDFTMATAIGGAVFPVGSRSVLFVGQQGVGTQCYGSSYGLGTGAPQTITLQQDNEIYFPPCWGTGNGHGNNTIPYKNWVWAIDALDLLSVKTGQKMPWDIKPYAVWPLELTSVDSINRGGGSVQGVAYDDATQTLYVSEIYGDNSQPLLHVFHVNVTKPAGGDTIPPTAPSGVMASSPSSHEVRVSWLPSTDDVGVVAYRVSRNGKPLSIEHQPTFYDYNLWPSATYDYTVRAVDADGNVSAMSAPASATTHSLPGPPQNVRVTSTGVLSWDAAMNAEGEKSAYYRIYRDGVPAPYDPLGLTAIAVTTETTFTDATMAPKTSYTYMVQALDIGLKLGGGVSVKTP